MRDHFLFPAQTNLELYAQAIGAGYSRTNLRRLGAAYLFGLRQVYPLARGSGKPFIAHLVGTASLVMASGCHEDWVLAALLHALYQNRIPFEGAISPTDRRNRVADEFGAGVADLIHRYSDFESAKLDCYATDQLAEQGDVLTLRLADELEDLSGHALALHGKLSDDAEVPGSYLWLRENKLAAEHSLLSCARLLGLEGIHRGLKHWLDFGLVPEGLDEMRTGWTSSVNVAEDTREDTAGDVR